MPEGPSILLLKNKLSIFIGKTVIKAGGYGPMETKWLERKKLIDIHTWGKYLFLIFSNGTVRLHLGLFGKIFINKQTKSNRSFFLEFPNGEMNCYVVKAVKFKEKLTELYDSRTDILSRHFSAKHVKNLLLKVADKEIDDVLMNQEIFTGVGNIIRNESLYLSGIHPKSKTGKIPEKKIDLLISTVKKYAREFFNQLEKHGKLTGYNVYKKNHTKDGYEVTMEVLPKSKRKIYYSEKEQIRY